MLDVYYHYFFLARPKLLKITCARKEIEAQVYKTPLINNYSPKWRWIVVDIYRAAKRRGKYPPLSPTLRCIIVSVYIYHTSWITSGLKSNFVCGNIPTKAILFFFGCSEVNSTWLITSDLANQRARKTLFTCVVYANYRYKEDSTVNGEVNQRTLPCKCSYSTLGIRLSYLLCIITLVNRSCVQLRIKLMMCLQLYVQPVESWFL